MKWQCKGRLNAEDTPLDNPDDPGGPDGLFRLDNGPGSYGPDQHASTAINSVAKGNPGTYGSTDGEPHGRAKGDAGQFSDTGAHRCPDSDTDLRANGPSPGGGDCPPVALTGVGKG